MQSNTIAQEERAMDAVITHHKGKVERWVLHLEECMFCFLDFGAALAWCREHSIDPHVIGGAR